MDTEREPKLTLSIPEFCRTVGISRSAYYNLVTEGTAPKSIRVGRRHLIPLTAAQAWIEAMLQANHAA